MHDFFRAFTASSGGHVPPRPPLRSGTGVCSVFFDNIDLQRKKCGISNLVVKGIKIRLQVYIENICISHMRKST